MKRTASARQHLSSSRFRTRLLASGSFAALLAFSNVVRAQEALPAIDIGGAGTAGRAPSAAASTDASRKAIMDAPPDTAATEYAVGPQGIDLASGGGGTNPIRGISYLPSVDAPQIDPYGLANIPGGNKGLRIRGEVGQHGNSTGTVEGLPLSGIEPGPGSTFLIDNENLSKIVLHEGPMPSNVNSYFTVGGAFDSQIRWPEEKMGGEISQSVGSFSFLRTFARVDTGTILNGTTKVFLSGSFVDADKWRGLGKSPQGKGDFNFGLDTRPTEAFEAKIFAAKTSFDGNTFRGLTYDQASNLGMYRSFDFAAIPGSLQSQMNNYYGYNLQHFDMWTAFSEFSLRLNEATRVVVKPYYYREDGYYLDGMANGMVRKWLIDHDMYGVVSEIQSRIADTDVTVGHWYGVQNLPGPPTEWQMFQPNAAGGLTGGSWSVLAQQKSSHNFNAAYGVAARDFGPLHLEAGARYVWEHMAGIDEYNSNGVTGLPYDTALALSSGVIPNRSVTGFTVGTFLPYGALSYDLTKDLKLKFSGGGGYGGGSYDGWPAYQQNANTFMKQGITAEQYWHSIRPETSTQLDLGLRWSFSDWFGSGFIEPTVYYSRNHNKNVSYDPGIGVPFSQNVGEAQGYGGQLMAHYSPIETVDLFASLGYQRLEFVQNLPTLPRASAATIYSAQVVGQQLPDVPYWISTLGANWRVDEFTFTPILHIVGSRSGDTSGFQPLAGYATLDLTGKYTHKLDWGTLEASLSIMNITDAHYIGFINNGYYQQSSSSGIYFPGPPRSVIAKIGYKF
jgi:iron complex outermembrane recepter protein